ncbi:MAG: GMC family oxidoreductase [Desulfobacterales bacterium]|nr:GMC family oxidoreductase [Desulfobacterales bacterium]MDJ0913852.1 GMC family oxidoreductase [Desulfobacterales bacterium]
MPKEPTYDFVIIGSGFGGSVSALRLAEKGYSVAVLEAGKRFRDEDFPKSNWNIFKYFWAPWLRCFGILRINLLSDVLILSGAGVGGGSLGYANTLLEPPASFFKDPQWAGMQDWQSTLAPHYRTAKQMLGVTRISFFSPADEVIQSVAEELGCQDTFSLQDVAVYFGEPEKTVPDPYFNGQGPDRTGCRLCGGCMIGCRYNAKNTLEKNYLFLAEKLGVKIIPETQARLIRELPEGGFQIDAIRPTSLSFKKRSVFHARRLIISAGVLGTLKLLFECREKGTLPNISKMLGARVRTNSESLTGATAFDKSADYTQGVAITSSIYPDKVTHIEPVRYPVGSDVMGFLATIFTEGGSPLLRPLKWIKNIICKPFVFSRTLLPLGWAKRSIILLVMQTLDNSVRVYRRQCRWWPFKKRLASKRETNRAKIPACIPQAQTATRVLAKKINGIPKNAINEVLFNIGTTAHILGGCVIGPNPDQGVIDAENRVYGYKDIYIVDGSMIPANLGVNPSLTITAMAEHAMGHIPPKNL